MGRAGEEARAILFQLHFGIHATPFRLQRALYRWDAEWDYWTAVQRLLTQQVFQDWKEGEPFPPLESIRPKLK